MHKVVQELVHDLDGNTKGRVGVLVKRLPLYALTYWRVPKMCVLFVSRYRGASLTKERDPLGPYRRLMPRVLGGS